mgnify:FL=1
MVDSSDRDAERPNVVFVHPHNLGQHVGCYGWSVDTPNVDTIADEGVRLENYFCTASHCSPARGSIWTGRYPHRNGLIGLAHLGWELHDDERTLVMDLNDAGYETYLFGLQHISSDPERAGFQHVQGSTHEFNVDEPAAEVAGSVEAFLGDVEPDDDPFFASVGFSEVHREPLVERCLDCGWTFDLEGYEPDDPEHVDPLPYLPDEPAVREELRHFQGMIGAVDEAVGRIDDALEAAGLADDTILVFTTDHGIGFPRSMGTCYDPGVETAFVARWPGEFDEGVVREELVSHVDFRSTMLELLGEPTPDAGTDPGDVDGHSFAPLLTGGEYEPRERVFLEFTWHSKYNPMRAVRTERYKYVRNFGDLPLVYIPAPLFSSEAGKVVRNEFYGEQRPEEELYDLEADPHERENLAGDDAYADDLARLRETVDEWMSDTDDRLLEGKWPPSDVQEERVWKSPWIPRHDGRHC